MSDLSYIFLYLSLISAVLLMAYFIRSFLEWFRYNTEIGIMRSVEALNSATEIKFRREIQELEAKVNELSRSSAVSSKSLLVKNSHPRRGQHVDVKA